MLVLRVLSLALLAMPWMALACDAPRCADVGGGQLQWDASLRLRGMYYDPARFGIGGSEDGYGLLRALASATYVEDNWQARLQLGVHAENGKAGGPGVPTVAPWTCSRPTGAGSAVGSICNSVGRKPAMAVRGCCRCAMGRTSGWHSMAPVQAGKAASARWT
ncbi:exported hypothetical protein [Stenotrophomonas thermophila]|nr:exported hypothetical protein [Stenotrophomonas maltophilia]